MVDENIALAWGCYLLGAAGLLLTFWRITRPIAWPRLRRQLLLIITVLLVYPFDIGDGYSQWAPATLMLLMETVFEGGEAFNRVGPALIAVIIGAMIILAVVELGLYFWRKKRQQQLPQAKKIAQVGDQPLVEGS